MRRSLKLHPESRCDAVTRIEVEAARPAAGRLRLRYLVTGDPGGLVLPAATAPARADGLWKHSCFEAFLRSAPGGAYVEVNLAPSRLWAAYAFDGYREGMQPAEIAAPQIETGIETGIEGPGYVLSAEVTLDALPELPGAAVWQLGLSAVIEEAGGRKSYWALAHPPGKPDFHHSDCFALELAAAWRP